MSYKNAIFVGKRRIAIDEPTYFIADIAANHDGNLERAKKLIYLAKEAGADCAKFQHFLADKIVSDYGFKHLKTGQSHQANWKKSVWETYDEYHCKREWTAELVKTCKDAEIDFMTTPYDFDAINEVDDYVNAYKIGSGDITWLDFIKKITSLNKPYFLACGASSLEDVKRAVDFATEVNPQIILMQCNTNYTASLGNYKYINLNVLKTFAKMYPEMILGLSDHTFGCATVLGAVTLGARVIEKHFTDDNQREGPDHKFAMNPTTWRDMVDRTRELELALGDGIKKVEDNEKDTVIVQRRSICLKRDMKKGEILTNADLDILRPSPEGAFLPFEINDVIGKSLNVDKVKGDSLYKGEINA